MLSNLKADVKGAWRLMLAHRAFSAVVVLTLAVGIGATTAMFAALEATMLRALPYPEPDRLVMGRATFEGHVNPWASAYDYYDYRDQSEAFESLGAELGFPIKTTVVGGEQPERLDTTFAAYNLFTLLRTRPAAGRLFTAAEGEEGADPVVLISHRYWQRRFGGAPDAVGGSLTVNGTPCTIVGVLPAGFRVTYAADLWFPMQRNGPYAGARRFHNWLLVGRLKPGVTLAQAQEQVDVISARLEAEYPDSNRTKALQLDPLRSAIVEVQRPRLLTLMGAVGLLLLIACGNVAGLLLARGSARRTELAVRAALGASRGRMVAQLLTENVVLALAGGVLGVVLAYWLAGLLPAVLGLDELGIARLGLNGPVLLFVLGLSLATGIVFGLVPALQSASARPARELGTGRTPETAGGARVRSVVVAAQVAISIMLLVGAGLFIKSVARLVSTDAGFDTGYLLTAEISLPSAQYTDGEQRIRFFDELLEEVRTLPGVRRAGMVSMLPLRNPGNNIYVWREGPKPAERDETNIAFTRIALPGYFEAIGIPLVLGRTLERTDTGDRPPVVVINQTMARGLFPDENPIGRRIAVDMGGDEPVLAEVVGVVGDARLSQIGSPVRQAMYYSYYQFQATTMRLAIRTEMAPESLVSTLRQVVWNRDPNLPVENLVSMEAIISDQVGPFRIMATVVSLFSAVALLLAAIGLYGVLAFYVSQRRHEIGVRLALGAEPGRVVRLVIGRGVWLVVTGLAVGIGGALAGGRLVDQLLYNVEATDLETYLTAGAVLAGVALVACLLPAWRASRVDPAVALRVE